MIWSVDSHVLDLFGRTMYDLIRCVQLNGGTTETTLQTPSTPSSPFSTRKRPGQLFTPRIHFSIIYVMYGSIDQQVQPGNPLPAADKILDITVFKGGTSVLADLYMDQADPDLNAQLTAFSFGFALQLLDDLQVVLRLLYFLAHFP